jgi:diguanylate cyclase (GGDEF)-like protein
MDRQRDNVVLMARSAKMARMAAGLDALASVAQELSRAAELDQRMQVLVDRAAQLLDVPRVVVRLIDPSRSRLMAVARAGLPLHRAPFAEFGVGQGLIGWVVAYRTPILAGDAEADPRFVQRPGMMEPLGSFVGVPLLLRNSCIGVLCASHRDRHHFTDAHQQMLTLLAALCAPHIETARLERLAQVDALTGALNRYGASVVLDHEEPLSVVMCDLDHFKQVNDRHGHEVGDGVLVRAATLLAGVLRAGDALVRWGGEEFLLVLPALEQDQALKLAERARRAIAEEPFRDAGRVTLSAGIAVRRRTEETLRLLRRADEALYRAKRAGRNRVLAAT